MQNNRNATENEKAIKEAVTHFEIILWYAIKNLIEKIEIL